MHGMHTRTHDIGVTRTPRIHEVDPATSARTANAVDHAGEGEDNDGRTRERRERGRVEEEGGRERERERFAGTAGKGGLLS